MSPVKQAQALVNRSIEPRAHRPPGYILAWVVLWIGLVTACFVSWVSWSRHQMRAQKIALDHLHRTQTLRFGLNEGLIRLERLLSPPRRILCEKNGILGVWEIRTDRAVFIEALNPDKPFIIERIEGPPLECSVTLEPWTQVIEGILPHGLFIDPISAGFELDLIKALGTDWDDFKEQMKREKPAQLSLWESLHSYAGQISREIPWPVTRVQEPFPVRSKLTQNKKARLSGANPLASSSPNQPGISAAMPLWVGGKIAVTMELDASQQNVILTLIPQLRWYNPYSRPMPGGRYCVQFGPQPSLTGDIYLNAQHGIPCASLRQLTGWIPLDCVVPTLAPGAVFTCEAPTQIITLTVEAEQNSRASWNLTSARITLKNSSFLASVLLRGEIISAYDKLQLFLGEQDYTLPAQTVWEFMCTETPDADWHRSNLRATTGAGQAWSALIRRQELNPRILFPYPERIRSIADLHWASLSLDPNRPTVLFFSEDSGVKAFAQQLCSQFAVLEGPGTKPISTSKTLENKDFKSNTQQYWLESPFNPNTATLEECNALMERISKEIPARRESALIAGLSSQAKKTLAAALHQLLLVKRPLWRLDQLGLHSLEESLAVPSALSAQDLWSALVPYIRFGCDAIKITAQLTDSEKTQAALNAWTQRMPSSEEITRPSAKPAWRATLIQKTN